MDVKTPKYIIKHANEKPSFVKQHWVIFSLLGLAFLTFLIGRYSHFDVLQAFKGQKQTWAEMNVQLSEANEASLKAISLLQTEVNVKQQAIKELQRDIGIMSQDNAALKAEVVFYENLLSHKDGIKKLRVFEVHAETINDWIQLKIVLAQKLEKAQLVKGKLKLKLKGIQGEEGQTINLIERFELENNFEFKYFQIKKYTISLPKGFNPTLLLVELQSKNKTVVTEQFQWNDIINPANIGSDNNVIATQN